MEVTRLFDLLRKQLNEFPQEKCLNWRDENGEWQSWSTAVVWQKAQQLALGLLKNGYKAGDKISAVVYKNRPEWAVADIATQLIGAIFVPVYPTISPSEYSYIFQDAQVKGIFIGSGDLIDKVATAKAEVPTLQHLISFDNSTVPGVTPWSDWLVEFSGDAIGIDLSLPKGDDLATLIYTSGTTGKPKGVMLTHNNILSNATSVGAVMPFSLGVKTLSFLPLCHIFEKAVLYAYFNTGANIYFTGTDNLGGETGDLQTVQPQFFSTVPRLLEKVYEKIYAKGMELTGIKKGLFFWALKQTDDFEYHKNYTGIAGIKKSIADKLIFSKWRAALGGNVEGILTGAAKCPEKILRVFSFAGVPIREAYGLTESSPGITANHFKDAGALIGTVGPVIEGCEVRIDHSSDLYGHGEGEILAAGPNIMRGYYNKPEATAETIVEMDGKRWLKTGDIGKLIDGPLGLKYLKITDRKKELLKTSGGKYVAPAPIENRFKEAFLIEQIMVVGEGRKFVSAVICPSQDALKGWCERSEIPWTSFPEMVKNKAVINKYQELIDRHNPEFSHIEQIKKFVLVPTEWGPTTTDGSDAELTPTMKLKRRVILKKYAADIEGMYQ